MRIVTYAQLHHTQSIWLIYDLLSTLTIIANTVTFIVIYEQQNHDAMLRVNPILPWKDGHFKKKVAIFPEEAESPFYRAA